MFQQTGKREWSYKFNITGGNYSSSSFDVSSSDKIICKIDGANYGQKRNDDRIPNKFEMEADAKFIAAAPKIVDALKKILSIINEDQSPEIKKAVTVSIHALQSAGVW